MANERTYQGPAVVVYDGIEAPVTAELVAHTEDGRQEWRGTLETKDEMEDFRRLVDRPVLLRCPGNRESEAVLRGWGGPFARAEGRGEPPF